MAPDPYRYFRIEARELLEGLTQGVLAIEKGGGGRELVERMLRFAHTLKGAARVVRQIAIAESAHAVEDALAPWRATGGPVPRERIGGLLERLDAIAAALRLLGPTAAAPPAGGASPPPAEEGFETVRVEIAEMDALLAGVAEAGVRIAALRREAADAGRARDLARALAERLRTRRGNGHGNGDAPDAVKARALADDLRSSLERLAGGLAAGVERAGRETDQVREQAGRIRLVPAHAMFAPLERAARDAAQALQKRIAFETAGGEHRLDAHVLAALRDALLHVVRNAVAHGIEPETERAAAGKPPVGSVRLQVDRRGSRVLLTCRDDGRGIDVEAIRRVAVRRGLIAAAEAGSLSLDDAVRLILRGGVSTTGAVTEVSGRGVGLDVVRTTADRLKGDVRVRSESGRGTTVEMSVPVSLSSLPALRVDAGGLVAAIPLDAVRRAARVVAGDFARSAGDEAIADGDRTIPFVPLAQVLRRALPPGRRNRPWSVVVVESGGARAAVGVDRLLGTAALTVRPLPALAEADAVVAGASLDVEGHPQLLLDPSALVEAARSPGTRPPDPADARRLPVLIVDDSLTTRMLEQSILETAGYAVDLATSGEEALRKARERRYGVYVVDVEMPGMNGFEFVEKTRADPALRETPAILVTSRGGPEDRRRGEQAGARAYIFKGEFDQAHLLRTIRELMA